MALRFASRLRIELRGRADEGLSAERCSDERARAMIGAAVIAGTVSGVLTIIGGLLYLVQHRGVSRGGLVVAHGILILTLTYGVSKRRLWAATSLAMQLLMGRAISLGHADPGATLLGAAVYGSFFVCGIVGIIRMEQKSQRAGVRADPARRSR
jgi:hypothetical protein